MSKISTFILCTIGLVLIGMSVFQSVPSTDRLHALFIGWFYVWLALNLYKLRGE